ncbi:MAG: IclR family transcriptional regulator [Desulfomicrobium sp.]|uniref:IclR family transcriptional regulator n=1 Tax=Hoeflea sp. TaxID=1940281 RepID=UPI0025B838B4|nr:IclR family transcriptional regulator [Hoeflea sp.]MBU4527149.1 IclR family transcriptional regulator [Alphaproteobacteria bacterium]MBV1713919.1 IclR family transcriptional regulator [Desulfomicrobium sp.]MBU4544131.1 IclR family transcriptional regulator [Alphaproteobacteria bacterium]MBU4552331.1 IclR family transcriptional regulator [Alphaproteobacteria bacterium]MBV1786208.1 IclR family transcriptional regulator [Hoeflea sp.]
MTRTTQPPVLASTLERGMRVLALFRDNHAPLSLTEISDLAGLEKSAAQRLTYTLHALGYLDRDDKTRRYRPGLRMLDLAYAYLIHDRLLERALPHMIETSRQVRATVNLGVLDRHEIVYKARIPYSTLAYDATLIGVRQPGAVTAIGQVMAAFSPPDVLEALLSEGMPDPSTPFTCRDEDVVRARVEQARSDGYVISVQQLMLQEIVVAAPVTGVNRHAVAAIGMAVYMPDWDEERVRTELVPAITQAARTISSSVSRI